MDCTFHRVSGVLHLPDSSQVLIVQQVNSSSIPEFEDYLSRGDPTTSVPEVTYAMDPTSSTMHGQTLYQPHSRSSLPTLHTRSAYPDSLDSSYEASPVDGYPYSSYSMPRNDSIGNPCDAGYRSWSSAPMMPPSSTSNTFEQQPTYSFGSMHTPLLPASQPAHTYGGRLPSVTADAFANMGHLYTSLPTQAAQDRRLPIPHTMPPYTQASYPAPELPEIRPLAEPRTHRNVGPSRYGMPWVSDMSTSAPYGASSISLAPPNGMPLHTTAMMPEASNGYHFPSHGTLPSTHSPSISPTAGPTVSNSYGNAGAYTMAPTNYGLPPITAIDRPGSSSARGISAPSNYYSHSFASSSDGAERTASSSERASSDASSSLLSNGNSSYPTMRHPQPQHPASLEQLRRQSSFEQQQRNVPVTQGQQRTLGSQRIAVADLKY